MILRLAALLLPVASGLAYAAVSGASRGALVGAGAGLVLGLVANLVPQFRVIPAKVGGVFLIAALYAAAIFGPEIEGAHRWIAAPAITLNSALVCLPPLAVFAARVRRGWLVAGLVTVFLAGLLQPDASILLSLGGIMAALGRRNLAVWVAAVLCAGVGAIMALYDRLDAVPHIEHVLQDAWAVSPAAAVALCLAFAGAMAIITLGLPRRGVPRSEAYALAGSLAGLMIASLLGPFPTPLLGLAPSAAIGTGVGLALLLRRSGRAG